MEEKMSLKQVEAKAWRSVFQDGLWDIYLGLLLLFMGVSSLFDKLGIPEAWTMSIYIPLLLLAMVILWAGKRFITLPRMGQVKFSDMRKARQAKVRLILFGSVVVGVIAWLVTPLIARSGNPVIFPALYALNMLVVFGLGAYFLQFERLYLIAILFAMPVPVDYFIAKTWGIDLGYVAFGIPALVIITIGVALLVHFVRSHPVLKVEG